MTKRLEGRPVAEALSKDILSDVQMWKARGVQPRMVTVLVGDDKASQVYALQKARIAKRLGISFEIRRFSSDITGEELEAGLRSYGDDPDVHGIMLELPLPHGLALDPIVSTIHALKDVDGLSPCHSIARSSPDAALYPATPLACIRLLNHYGYHLQGKDVTVVGCGRTVGMPLIHLLISHGATVTACHEHTKDVRAHLAKSEIAFLAVGKGGLIAKDMVHDGLTVVDVGISESATGEVQGDLSPDAVDFVEAYTPTPGGLGSVTTMQIFANLMHAMRLQEESRLERR